MSDKYFEDYVPGQRFEHGAYTIAQAEIVEFALRYDPQTLHTDEAAARAGFFGRLTASGWQTAAIGMRLFILAGIMPKRGAVGVGLEGLRWTRPVYPGDTLRLSGEILSAEPDAKRHVGTLRIAMTLYNQREKAVLTQTAVCLVDRRPCAQAG